MKKNSSESANKSLQWTIFLYLACFALTIVCLRANIFELDKDLADDNVPVVAAAAIDEIVEVEEDEILPEAPENLTEAIYVPEQDPDALPEYVGATTAFNGEAPDDAYAENGEAIYWLARLDEWKSYNEETGELTPVAVWEASEMCWSEIAGRKDGFNKTEFDATGWYTFYGTSIQYDIGSVYELADSFAAHYEKPVLFLVTGEGVINVAIFIME